MLNNQNISSPYARNILLMMSAKNTHIEIIQWGTIKVIYILYLTKNTTIIITYPTTRDLRAIAYQSLLLVTSQEELMILKSGSDYQRHVYFDIPLLILIGSFQDMAHLLNPIHLQCLFLISSLTGKWFVLYQRKWLTLYSDHLLCSTLRR